jgi:ribulose-phosphate 3-epimerase
MSIICPTITETHADPKEYKRQMERIEGFATRIQIDLMDGHFAPTRSINPIQVWWPDGILVDIHLMFARPLEHIETLVSLNPQLAIIHAEAEGDLLGMIRHLQDCGIQAGVCLLKETTAQKAEDLIAASDHVLLFSGELGKFGGMADMRVLDKVQDIRAINPAIEIGWDGGANERNVRQLKDGGIDVINVGGAIQKADDPKAAYATLVSKLSE